MNINETLEKIPALKARACQEAEEKRLVWQQRKEVYANEEAKFVLRLKAEFETLKSTEIKYYINSDPDLYQKRLELIVMEADYRKKEKEVEAYDDEFTSAKMLARLKISELGSIEFNK